MTVRTDQIAFSGQRHEHKATFLFPRAMKRSTRWLIAVPFLTSCVTQSTSVSPGTPAPDLGKRAVAEHGMVSSANPRASEAGIEMLRRGGNAIDAAVATAFTVSVGEPQMSGLGGGGGMLIWLQKERRAEYIDFYSAQRAESWKGIKALDSTVANLRIVGIPGEVAGLLEAHERYGKLSRADVLAPAIRMAEEGFPVNQVLADMIVESRRKLSRFPASMRLFYRDTVPLRPGDMLRNSELAAALRRVADEGRKGFYEGETARAIVQELNSGHHPASMADLAAFTPQWKRPLCTEYRGFVVLSAPPPQTGLQLLHTLNLLEPHDLRALGYPTQSAEAFDVIASAIRVANSDTRFNSDPNWAFVPAAGVVSKSFASSRHSLVGTGRANTQIARPDSVTLNRSTAPSPGCAPFNPYGATGTSSTGSFDGPDLTMTGSQEGGETTHMSVVDAEGNAVALTQTNSTTFGIGATVSGFLLNDSGGDLSRGGANATGRHPWRIRNSTISPTIVLKDNRAHLVLGAPGGGRIQAAILQTMVYVLDYDLDPLDAVRMPRIYPSATQVVVETENGFNATVLGKVRDMGYVPTPDAVGYARMYVIARKGNRWVGAADPRHNGEVRGY
jgi:gamma-glutamyltranspeptidase/glutathione hydrolase